MSGSQYALSFYSGLIDEYKGFAQKMRVSLGENFDTRLAGCEGPEAREMLIWATRFDTIEKANNLSTEVVAKLWQKKGESRPNTKVTT